MLKTSAILITLTHAHKPVPLSVIQPNATPPTYKHLAALGEAYHNAWRRCVSKTTDWIYTDLNVNGEDPSFDNGYYVEYKIMEKVPRVYEIFHQLLGEENYWPAPSFVEGDDNFRVDSNYSRAQTVPNADELPDPYVGNTDKSWITEHNHLGEGEVSVYEGVDPKELKLYSPAGKMLKELFYNIQQTSYYCDFTLESAQSSFEKLLANDKAELIEAERDFSHDMWAYILKKQIAPMRWSLQMWTRFNIAEPSIRNMLVTFDEGWENVESQVKKLPMEALATSLGFDFKEKFAEQGAIHEKWVEDINTWIGACYPAPNDRQIKTSAKICQYGMDSKTIGQAIKDADAMWKDFFYPLLNEFKNHDDFSQTLYDESHTLLKDEVWNTGKAHSFRCEWKFIDSRVRYFEVIPTWELERIRDDTKTQFDSIIAFREELLKDYPVEATGIYSQEKLDEMTEFNTEIREFLLLWSQGDKSVFDKDEELNRLNLRKTTVEFAQKANKVYQWYWLMGFKQFEWKEGAPHDFDSQNFNYGNKTAKFCRRHVTSYSRLGYRKQVWRELVKLNFHMWRRI